MSMKSRVFEALQYCLVARRRYDNYDHAMSNSNGYIGCTNRTDITQ